jgi:hypothetical protein
MNVGKPTPPRKKQADRLSRVSRWGATLFCKLQEKCRPNSQRGTRTSIETINRESIDGTCVGWQARWTVSLPAIVNNREKTMRL